MMQRGKLSIVLRRVWWVSSEQSGGWIQEDTGPVINTWLVAGTHTHTQLSDDASVVCDH